MTLAWLQAQIEDTLAGDNTAKNVYDLAMLCICRDEVERRATPVQPESIESDDEDKRKRDAVVLTAYSADLDTVPTIEQIDDALGSIAVNTEQERQRARDMRTWSDIIKGSRE